MSKTAFKGSVVNLAGEFIKTGVTAPEFTMVKGDLSQFKLSDTKGKFVVLNIFPSLDNPSDFDSNYGVLIADGPLSGLLARSVVVINPAGEIVYTELVPEITQEPNYDAALAAIR